MKPKLYPRAIQKRLISNQRSVLLLGPRQVGKSTLLASLSPDWSLNLASASVYRDYVREPERLERELAAAPATTRTVLIDEVQKLPALLDSIQHVIDNNPKRFRFLLSGSSARKLRRGHANLLPGRIHLFLLHPLLECELGNSFDLERAMAHGTLPGIYAETDADTRAADLRSYTDAYLREEVQAEALVRDLGGYARLLDLVAAGSGNILNLQSLCREAGISYETARRYLEILEDTLLIFRVPAWSGSDRASLIAHPRIYIFDIGVRNALLRRPLDKPLADERGLLLEHIVAYELHNRLSTLWPDAKLYHFRTRNDVEVDFVLEVDRELWGIEVKAARQVSRHDCKGLAALGERTKQLKRQIIVYLGDRAQRIGNVEVLPLIEFLGELPR
ncbi:MAG: ATP-binding protein [Planctomycetota bacterium]